MLRWSLGLSLCLAAAPAMAQTPPPAWLQPELLSAAKLEGALTIYSSVNEQEALPLWKEFETATGIKVNYIRGNDSAITSRIQIEARTGQHAWDALLTTNLTRMPVQLRARIDPPQAAGLDARFQDPGKTWFGVYANYNAPAYNTKLVSLDAKPRDFEEFMTHKEWIGRVGIDAMEFPWLRAMIVHYGEENGTKLVKRFFEEFKPVPVDGHLALARAIGAGEYVVTPSNYVNLTNNVASSGAPTDYWGQDPIAVILGQAAVNAKAPHPKAALLAVNFLISAEGQTLVARFGRLPVRAGVKTVPADAITKLGSAKLYPMEYAPEDEKIWQKRFQELIRGR